uniref:Uncharacterized protein n=1 Tax=Panagrolaimus davidi TaxID=227884 RepID=A0A914Q230_9BILA
MSAPRGILSNDATRNNNSAGHVTFDPATADNIRSSNPPSTPPPPPEKVTAPVVNFPIKDEVELLRSGVLNVHGTNVKSQAEQK